MSIIVFLFIPIITVQGYPQQYLQQHGSENNCIASCPRTCSPDCLPSCCTGNAVQESPVANGICLAGCPAHCSPHCTPECCTGDKRTPKAKAKPGDMMITGIEEGETEEVGDKGFGSPSDNSEDPPGTITIPLPPTMYVPPKPGEAPKELPLPDFQLPAELLNGKLPKTSQTLNPEKTATGGACVGNVVNESPPVAVAGVSPPIASPAKPACTLSFGAMAIAPPAPPAPPPPPPPPPPMLSTYNHYPKLPPVTVSEIPNRVNRMPPLLLPKPKANFAPPLVPISLGKPPPIHINAPAAPPVAVLSDLSAAPLAATPLAASPPAPAVALAGASGGQHPVDTMIAQKMAEELSSSCGARCGVSYGKVPAAKTV